MSTKAYRELIRSTIQQAAQRLNNAAFFLAGSPADTNTLEKTANELRAALNATEQAIGSMKAHRALTEGDT